MIVEVMIGFGVVIVAMVALLQLSNKSVGNSGAAERQSQSTRYATEGLDWVKGQQQELGWTEFLALAAPDSSPPRRYCLNDLSWTHTGSCGTGTTIANSEFTRNLEMSYSTDGATGKNIVNVQLVVSWYEGDRMATTNRTYQFTAY